jgi:hypothetical protein
MHRYALQASTGKERWKFSTGGSIESGLVLDPATGTVLFGSDDEHIYSVKAQLPPLKPAPVPSSFTPAAAAAAIAAVGAVAVVAAAVPAAVGAAGGSAASASSAAASGTAMSVMITHLQSAALVSNLDGVKWKGAMRKFVDKLQTVNFRFGNTTTPAPTPRVVVNKGSWHAEKYGFEAGLEGETKSSKKPLAKDLENMLLVLIGLFVLSFVIWGSVVGWRRCRGRYAGESDSVHVLTLAVLVFITDKAFQPLVSHATKQIVFTAAGDLHDDRGTVFLAVAVLLLVLAFVRWLSKQLMPPRDETDLWVYKHNSGGKHPPQSAEAKRVTVDESGGQDTWEYKHYFGDEGGDEVYDSAAEPLVLGTGRSSCNALVASLPFSTTKDFSKQVSAAFKNQCASWAGDGKKDDRSWHCRRAIVVELFVYRITMSVAVNVCTGRAAQVMTAMVASVAFAASPLWLHWQPKAFRSPLTAKKLCTARNCLCAVNVIAAIIYFGGSCEDDGSPDVCEGLSTGALIASVAAALTPVLLSDAAGVSKKALFEAGCQQATKRLGCGVLFSACKFWDKNRSKMKNDADEPLLDSAEGEKEEEVLQTDTLPHLQALQKLGISNPDKYIIGAQAKLADPEVDGWFVHDKGYTSGNSGAGFIMISAEPPGTSVVLLPDEK